MRLGQEILQGAIDLHVHAAPDVIKRRNTDLELARIYANAGMAGFVSKAHHGDTTARAAMIREMNPALKVFGGVTLNRTMGGINPAAVETAGRMGGKFVWFPTVDAANDYEYHQKRRKDASESEDAPNLEKISILNEGKLISPVREVLELIQKYDMVLCTGHLSPAESLTLIKAASEMKIQKIIVNHVSLPITLADLDTQRQYIQYGAMLEHCYYTPYYLECTWEELYRQVREVGPEHIVLSSDMGQKKSPSPADGLMDFAEKFVTEGGFSKEQAQRMFVENPQQILKS